MVGTAETFLKYNQENTMKQLLALEGHLQHLSPSYEGEEASCLVKHALILSEQCDEGVSHASQAGATEKAEIFREINRGASEIEKKIEAKTPPTELIKTVRELRNRAEKFSPLYNLEKCKACGALESLLERLKADEGNENALNRKTYNHSDGEKRMVSYREIGVVYGAQHIAKGAERGFEEIDKYAGVSAQQPHLRYSTWLNMGLGLGLPIITAVWKRIRDPWDMLLISAGAHMSTKIWDYAEEYATATAAMVAPRYVRAPTAPAVTPTPSVTPSGRYVVIG